MSKIEDVATAIFAAADAEGPIDDRHPAASADRAYWLGLAKAAIASMKEPTAEMYVAGDRCILDFISDNSFSLRSDTTPARECWGAMINTALSEGI